jgi:hypothetical protein
MTTKLPATLAPQGPWPAANDADIYGGLHVVSAIANWAAETPAHVRRPYMPLVDATTGIMWALNGTMDGIVLTMEAVDRLALRDELNTPPYPGDPHVLARDVLGNATLVGDVSGITRGAFVVYDIVDDRQAQPGDWTSAAEDPDGRQVSAWRADGSLAAKVYLTDIVPAEPEFPGDPVALARDSRGRATIADEGDGTIAVARLRVGGELYVPGGGSGGGGGSLTPAVPQTEAAWMHAWAGDDGAVYYLSTRWRGELHGFEERGEITLAQTPQLASIVCAFGGGSMGTARTLAETWPWHIRDQALEEAGDTRAAASFSALYLEQQEAALLGLSTTVVVTEAVGSMVEADALAGSAARVRLENAVVAAKTALADFGKIGVVDAVLLALLDGAPGTSEAAADFHYAGVAGSLREALAGDTAVQPIFVVTPSAGTRTSGTSQVGLAEARLERNHFDLGFLVAGPMYPYALEAGTAAALDPAQARLLDELRVIAYRERLAGRPWQCPLMLDARITGDTITVRWEALSDLVGGTVGYRLEGVSGATISSVTNSGTDSIITLSGVPTLSSPFVSYAHGFTGDQGNGLPSNRGNLRDSYGRVSDIDGSHTHRRSALPGRVAIFIEE